MLAPLRRLLIVVALGSPGLTVSIAHGGRGFLFDRRGDPAAMNLDMAKHLVRSALEKSLLLRSSSSMSSLFP